MSLAEIALCFACAVLGAVVGIQLFFWLGRVRVNVDLTFRSQPMCPECGKALGTKHFMEETKASTDAVMKR